MVVGDALYFVFGSQYHADPLVQLGRLNVQNAFPAVGRRAACLFDITMDTPIPERKTEDVAA